MSCSIGNLSKLVCCRVRSYSNVTHYYNAILTILLLVCDEQHSTTYASDTWSALDNLKSWTESIASSAQCTRNLTVSALSLDNHTTEVEVVLSYEFTSLLYGHALLLAKFSELLSILLSLRVVLWINDSSLVDVVKTPLSCEILNIGRVTDEDDVCEIISQNFIGCFQCTLLFCFREHDALLVSFSASYDLL